MINSEYPSSESDSSGKECTVQESVSSPASSVTSTVASCETSGCSIPSSVDSVSSGSSPSFSMMHNENESSQSYGCTRIGSMHRRNHHHGSPDEVLRCDQSSRRSPWITSQGTVPTFLPKPDSEYHRQVTHILGREWRHIRLLREFLGCLICGIIGTLYYVTPIYFFYCLFMAVFLLSPFHLVALASLLVLSMLPLVQSKTIRTSWLTSCIAEYFNLEIISDLDEDSYLKHPKKFLILAVPHGVISFGGIAAATMNPGVYGPTAVADVLMRIPILRHIFGLFHMIPSDRHSIQEQLKKGHVFLYPGGLAELFMSNRKREELFFEKRKGCINVAMHSGADILVVYIMGNTDMFNIIAHGPLAKLSRAIKSSVTFFWGRFGLPIPFKTRVFFLVGTPISLPDRRHSKPSPEEVDEAHGKVKLEMLRLFEEHKHRHPSYAKKTLHFR